MHKFKQTNFRLIPTFEKSITEKLINKASIMLKEKFKTVKEVVEYLDCGFKNHELTVYGDIYKYRADTIVEIFSMMALSGSNIKFTNKYGDTIGFHVENKVYYSNTTELLKNNIPNVNEESENKVFSELHIKNTENTNINIKNEETVESLFKLSMNHDVESTAYLDIMSKIRLHLIKIHDDKWNEVVAVIKLDKNLSINESKKNVLLAINAVLKNGYNKNIFADKHFKYLLNEAKIMYLPRYLIEYDRRFIQICVMIVAKTDNDSIVLSERLTGDMKNMISLISGHVDYSDEIKDESVDYIYRTAKKEMMEETNMNITDFKINSVIMTDNTNVSKCHMGIVCECFVNVDDMHNNEPNNQRIYLERVVNIHPNDPKYENWTSYTLADFLKK